MTGWTVVGNVLVGSSSTAWNAVALSSIIPACTQYCGIQTTATISSISQNITFQVLNYVLTFWIIGRNASGAPNRFSTSRLNITVGGTSIISYAPTQSVSAWVKVSVPFTVLSAGSKVLKFENSPAQTDSTLLLASIYITVA